MSKACEQPSPSLAGGGRLRLRAMCSGVLLPLGRHASYWYGRLQSIVRFLNDHHLLRLQPSTAIRRDPRPFLNPPAGPVSWSRWCAMRLGFSWDPFSERSNNPIYNSNNKRKIQILIKNINIYIYIYMFSIYCI